MKICNKLIGNAQHDAKSGFRKCVKKYTTHLLYISIEHFRSELESFGREKEGNRERKRKKWKKNKYQIRSNMKRGILCGQTEMNTKSLYYAIY